MPVIPLRKPALHPRHAVLVDELGRHLEPDARDLPDYPRIYVETTRTDALRAWVVWDEWDEVCEAERSQIILEAYERTLGRAEALRLSLALGLTRREARDVGIEPAG